VTGSGLTQTWTATGSTAPTGAATTAGEGGDTSVVFTEPRRVGCDQAQGYFLSRPVSAVELDHWLSNRPELDQSTDIGNRPHSLDRVLVTRTPLGVAGQPVSRHVDLVQ
jgi:hypothetical protein